MTVYDTAAKLPPIDVVRDRSRALAMLDTIIDGVYHDSPMHNYTGGQLWPGLLEGLPQQFAPLVHEPAFCHEGGTLDATIVLWRRSADDRWHGGEGIDLSPADDEETDPDGAWLLDALSFNAAASSFQSGPKFRRSVAASLSRATSSDL